jgi:hypothetical protein
MPTFKQTSKPTPSALCKAPTGIVVVKPQPKPTPLPEPLQTLLPTLPTQRPEHLRPLSAVAVPIAKANTSLPVVRCTGSTAAKKKPPPKPSKSKGPAPRVLTPEDIAEQEFIAELIEAIVGKLKRVSKVTIVCRFNGYFAMGAIVRGLHVAIKRGKVVKDTSVQPSLYSLKPIKPVVTGWTTKWTPPVKPTTGWVNHL